jgi:hypothetical protein
LKPYRTDLEFQRNLIFDDQIEFFILFFISIIQTS